MPPARQSGRKKSSSPRSRGGTAPKDPGLREQLMRRLESGHMELSALTLTGSYARLCLYGCDFGSIALLLPGYRERNP